MVTEQESLKECLKEVRGHNLKLVRTHNVVETDEARTPVCWYQH